MTTASLLLFVMTNSKLSSKLILPMMSLPPTQEMTRRLRACAREGGTRARASKNGIESEGERYRHTYPHTCHWTHADDGVGRGACTYAGTHLHLSIDISIYIYIYIHTHTHTMHVTADDGVGRGACTYAGAGLPDSCDVCWRQRAHGESIRVHWQDECLH